MMKQERKALVINALKDASGTGEWRRVNCPICPLKLGKVDRKRALSVNAFSGWWNCWRCGAKGRVDPIDDFSEEVEFIQPGQARIDPPEGFMPLWEDPGLTAEVMQPARDYLVQRGVNAEMAHRLQIGAVLNGYYANRVVIPILPTEGEGWLGWVSRAWYKGASRPYLNAKGMTRQWLYNHSAILEETDQPLLVVEGIFDALAFFPDAVAVLGKPTDEQVGALAAARRPVSVVLDGDAWTEGMLLAWRLREMGQRAGFVALPPEKDPDEVDKDWLRAEALLSLDETLKEPWSYVPF